MKTFPITWSVRHGAWKLDEGRGTFSLHASREAAEAYAAKLGLDKKEGER